MSPSPSWPRPVLRSRSHIAASSGMPVQRADGEAGGTVDPTRILRAGSRRPRGLRGARVSGCCGPGWRCCQFSSRPHRSAPARTCRALASHARRSSGPGGEPGVSAGSRRRPCAARDSPRSRGLGRGCSLAGATRAACTRSFHRTRRSAKAPRCRVPSRSGVSSVGERRRRTIVSWWPFERARRREPIRRGRRRGLPRKGPSIRPSIPPESRVARISDDRTASCFVLSEPRCTSGSWLSRLRPSPFRSFACHGLWLVAPGD
jgi:hypothetical protein